jgi:hypothetical protein
MMFTMSMHILAAAHLAVPRHDGVEHAPSEIPSASALHAPRALEQNAESACQDIMEVLYLVFRESIRDTSNDKQYYLHKLRASSLALLTTESVTRVKPGDDN